LRAALICPDSGLREQFIHTASAVSDLAIIAEVRSYGSNQELTEAARRQQLDAVFVDVDSQREAAVELLGRLSDHWPAISAAGLSRTNDPEAILQCLRSGATEFLCAPFAETDLAKAVERMLRKKATEVRTDAVAQQRGHILVFAPAKGGVGSTTIACNSAFRLHKASKERVLLADFDLTQGIISFLLRMNPPYSVSDALTHAGQLDSALWESLVTKRQGVEVLAAPPTPMVEGLEAYPVQALLEYARSVYDYVVVDLGGVCDPVALAALPMADEIYPVCATDMPGLYLMRRTIQLLEEMGYSRDQIHVLVNRFDRNSEITTEDMQTIFRTAVAHTFPSDPPAVERAMRDGVPISDSSALAKRIGAFVDRFLGEQERPAAKPAAVRALKELLSGA